MISLGFDVERDGPICLRGGGSNVSFCGEFQICCNQTFE